MSKQGSVTTKFIFALVLASFAVFAITNVYASASVASRVKGRIVLQVEKNGEAWYVNPTDSKRYYLGTPDMAFDIMKQLGVGIANNDLAKMPVGLIADTNTDSDKDGLNDDMEKALGTDPKKSDTDNDGYSDKSEVEKDYNPKGSGSLKIDSSFTKTNTGKIFLQVEGNGQAWYVNPVDQRRYFLGRPSDAFSIMRSLGLGITTVDLEKIVSGSAISSIPYYFIAIHNEPFHDEYNSDERLAAAYITLKEMVAKADKYNIKLTLMFTAQWSDYILASSDRKADLAAWKKNGHEISAHHHETGHGNWDGYTNKTKEEAGAERQKLGKKESYLGNIEQYYERLSSIDSNIVSGCLNEEANKDALADKVTYLTCSGFLNNGPVGVRVGDADSRKAKNDYITVGTWKGIKRKWLNHFQVTTAEREKSAEEMFNTMNSSQVSGSVTHSLEGEAESFYSFLEFLHSKDPSGINSRTVTEVIDEKLIPEKTVTDEQLAAKYSAPSDSLNKLCGDGVCDAAEKANQYLCPMDCSD